MTEISRRQFAASVVVVVLVVLLGGRALRADTGAGDVVAPGAVEEAVPGGLAGTAGATGAGGAGARGGAGGGVELSAAGERPIVHVAGAVRRPGVYELEAGARIRDAVAQAGGGRTGADLDALNLAAKVTDGQQVLVARKGRSGGAAAGTGTAAGAAPVASSGAAATGTPAGAAGTATVNVNQADAVQLETLDGVGPAIAAKIIDWRTQNGPFRSVDDLAQVAGIGPKKLEAMRARASV